MTKLPPIQWRSIMIPNPARRWWTFWRPRMIADPTSLRNHIIATNDVMSEMPWVESQVIR